MDALYTTSATSSGSGRDGKVALDDGTLDVNMAPPKELGGKGEGSNPEQLFALGYAGCFHSAVKMTAGRMKQPSKDSTVTAAVSFCKAEKGFELAVELAIHMPGVEPEDAREIAETAHKWCPYSRATRGNIPVELKIV